MVEKYFRVISNSKEYLNADMIAMALLKQITLNPTESNAKFVVVEVGGSNYRLKRNSCLKNSNI